MKFGELRVGDKFIFPCAVRDGEDKTLGISVYLKLEFPVVQHECPKSNPRTAVKIKSGTFMGILDEEEILKIQD